MSNVTNTNKDAAHLRARAWLLKAQTDVFLTILQAFPDLSEQDTIDIAYEVFGLKSLRDL